MQNISNYQLKITKSIDKTDIQNIYKIGIATHKLSIIQFESINKKEIQINDTLKYHHYLSYFLEILTLFMLDCAFERAWVRIFLKEAIIFIIQQKSFLFTISYLSADKNISIFSFYVFLFFLQCPNHQNSRIQFPQLFYFQLFNDFKINLFMMKNQSYPSVAFQRQKRTVKLISRESINVELQTEDIKDNPNEQPIFRINSNLLNLKYEVNDQAYLTKPNLLYRTKIKPQDREKLKSWLMCQTQKSYERETYALASKYLDMYFSKGFKVGKDSFQAFGIACLILAAKVNERRTPSISFQVFNREQIFGFQIQLLQKFNFKVNPVTYVSLCQLLLTYWDNYNCQRHSFPEIKYFQDGNQSIRRYRIIMQTLDCFDLVTESLATPMSTNVICVFYLQNRRFCLQKYKKQNANPVQTTQQYNFHCLYDSFMEKFLKSVIKEIPAFSSAQLNYKKFITTMYFSRIAPKIALSPKYRNFCFQITRQTYNPQITKMAQNYFVLKNQNAHSSR